MSARAIGLVAATLLFACSSETPRTQVMAVVIAEPGVDAISSTARIRVSSLADSGETTEQLDDDVDLEARPFPIRVAIVPIENDATRRFRLDVDAVDSAGGIVASARVESGFIAERTLALVVVLYDACVGTACSEDRTCGEDGVCVDVAVDPSTLPDYTDGDGGTDADGSADATRADAPVPDGAGMDGGPDAGLPDGGPPVDGGCTSDIQCGTPMDVFGDCAFGDTCTTAGTRPHTLNTPTCSAGTCTVVPSMDTTPCMRASTDGTTCGAPTVADGPCTRGSECGSAGTYTQTTTTYTCSGGTCTTGTSATAIGCSLAPVGDATPCSAGYCCAGSCVGRNSNEHCGVCGMNCTAQGQTCTNAISNNGGTHALPGAWVCTCPGLNSTCVALGYGAAAGCFGGHCQCQCPTSPSSCGGQCFTGTCFEDTLEAQSDNFCGY